MESLRVEHTYGQALYDAAKDRGIVDLIVDEYKSVTSLFRENPLLVKLFKVPTLSAANKTGVAEKVFSGWVSNEMLGFICILIKRNRIGAWDSIGRHFEKLVWESNGITKGVVYSAVPLDRQKTMALEKKTGEALGKEVYLDSRTDKSLIGGVTIYIDGKIIDASVRTRLESIMQRMKQ